MTSAVCTLRSLPSSQRIVIKEQYFHGYDKLNRQRYWYSDVDNREALEAVLHWRLSSLEKSNHIVKFLCYRWYPQTVLSNRDRLVPSYKIYMDYYEHGDLAYTVCEHEYRHSSAALAKAKRPKAKVTHWRIPENFVWCVFEALVEAALLMQRGAINGHNEAWAKQIVHLDIKPLNVFLASSYPSSCAQARGLRIIH